MTLVDRQATTALRGRSAVLVAVLLYLTLGDRVWQRLGGSDTPLLAVVVVAVVLVAGLQLPTPPSRILAITAARCGFLPYLVLQALLPLLALLFLDAAPTALGALLPVGLAMGGLVLGALAIADPALRHGLLQKVVPFAVLAHALWAAVQAARTAGLLSGGLRELSLLIDLGHIAGLAAIPVFNRSTGWLSNPNALGLLGAVGFLFALQFSAGRPRTATCTAAVFCLATSGSRGALVAFLCGLLAWGVQGLLLRSRAGLAGPDRRSLARSGRIALLCLVPALLAISLQWERLVGPVTGLSRVVSEDGDLGARLVFWQGAWQFLGDRPVGTFLTPEHVLGTSIDSDVFRTLSQGGPLFMGTLLLGYGTALLRAVRLRAPALVGLTVALLVAGVTMNALLYLPALLLWVAIGLTMGPSSERAGR